MKRLLQQLKSKLSKLLQCDRMVIKLLSVISEHFRERLCKFLHMCLQDSNTSALEWYDPSLLSKTKFGVFLLPKLDIVLVVIVARVLNITTISLKSFGSSDASYHVRQTSEASFRSDTLKKLKT